MAKIITYVCGNCGEPYIPESSYKGIYANRGGWFTNKFGEECHYCSGGDGKIGGMVESEEYTPPPKSIIERLPKCPCCGRSMRIANAAQWTHFRNVGGKPGGAAGQTYICPLCLIMFSDSNPNDYYLGSIDLKIMGYAGTDKSLDRHVEWVRSLSGYAFKQTESSRLLGISEDYMAKIIFGGTRTPKTPVICGSCGGEMKVIHRHSTAATGWSAASKSFLHTRKNIPLRWPEVAYTMVCRNDTCKREDYYYWDGARKKWTWAGMDFDLRGLTATEVAEGGHRGQRLPDFYPAGQAVPGAGAEQESAVINPVDSSDRPNTGVGFDPASGNDKSALNKLPVFGPEAAARERIILKAREMGVSPEAFAKLAQEVIARNKAKRPKRRIEPSVSGTTRVRTGKRRQKKAPVDPEIAEIANKIKAVVEQC